MDNKVYKIDYKFNPTMQCVLNRLNGYMLVIDDLSVPAYYSKKFTYNGRNWNALIKHIQENKLSDSELYEMELNNNLKKKGLI